MLQDIIFEMYELVMKKYVMMGAGQYLRDFRLAHRYITMLSFNQIYNYYNYCKRNYKEWNATNYSRGYIVNSYWLFFCAFVTKVEEKCRAPQEGTAKEAVTSRKKSSSAIRWLARRHWWGQENKPQPVGEFHQQVWWQRASEYLQQATAWAHQPCIWHKSPLKGQQDHSRQ